MDWNDRPYEWVGDWSARRAALTPDREALVDATSGERYTYADLDGRANRTARLLREYGVEAAGRRTGDEARGHGTSDRSRGDGADDRTPGDGADDRTPGDDAGERVAVVSRNRVEVFDLFFATGKTGGVLAPLSHRLATRELAELLALVEPRLLVVEAPFTGPVADALADSGADPDVLQLPAADRDHGSGTNPEASTPLAADPYHDALPADTRENAAPVDTADVALDDVHLLLHTGGSTGTPKETELTHGSICWNSLNTITAWGLRPDDVAPMVFPTFHTGGWNVLTLPLFHQGGTVVIDREVEPGRVLAQIDREDATVFVAVPAVLRAMVEHEDWPETDRSTLRFVKSGGGPCREPVIEAWRERGVDISQGYGLTECGPNNFAMPDDWAPEKVASVGKPALHVDTRIVDETGEAVARGDVGELELAGQHAAAGYWQNDEETAATFGPSSDQTEEGRDSDGAGGRWVSTGDLFRVDADGFYHFVGRTKTMFTSGGENVHPPVVEDAIVEHPAVADVIVIGVPDKQWGTVGKAVIEPTADASAASNAAASGDEDPLTRSELDGFLEDRLAGYEIPASIAFVDELPTSGPSKVDRQAVEAQFGEEKP